MIFDEVTSQWLNSNLEVEMQNAIAICLYYRILTTFFDDGCDIDKKFGSV